jgi:lipopolysaccharide export system protein LptA
MRRLPPAVAAALVAAALSAGHVRPISAEPREPPAEPLAMSSDRLELDAEARTAVLTGHVKLARGPMSLSCPRVDVRYDQVPHVTWVKGSGGVVAEVKGVRAEAPEVELDLASRTMELRGGVRLSLGDGWLTAERASINIATAKVTMSEVKGSIPVRNAPPAP